MSIAKAISCFIEFKPISILADFLIIPMKLRKLPSAKMKGKGQGRVLLRRDRDELHCA
jgi:hypothetical protein